MNFFFYGILAAGITTPSVLPLGRRMFSLCSLYSNRLAWASAGRKIAHA